MESRGISPDWLSELKRKNDLASIASNYVRLEQKGHTFWACCPFHSEKTPSFSINNDEGFYHCFGCKESGDVIKFVQKMENVDFMDAVKILAEKAHMEIPEFEGNSVHKQNQKKKERLLSCLDFTCKHYIDNLYSKEAKQAQDYIRMRKFNRRVLEDFKIGFSKDWNDLPTYLKSKGFTEDEMLESGVCAKKNGHVFDVLAGRLAFPIFNAFNECIGFSARSLVKTDFAKYKNTAETMLFQKGRVVYGINILKAQKQQQLVKNVILVEGQMDVIAMHKAGFKTAVACMGTALTKDHITELKRYSNQILLCFDGDGAGQKATLRAIEMWRGENVDLRVVRLAGGKDPDEILNTLGAEKLSEMIDSAENYMQWLINYHKSQFDLNSPEGKGKFVKAALAEVKKLGSEALYEPYLEKLRDLTNIPLEILRRDINSTSAAPKLAQKQKDSAPQKEASGGSRAQKYVLACLLHGRAILDKQLDYDKLLAGYEKYLALAKRNLPISAIFDIEGASEDMLLMELVNFNFAEVEKDEGRYFSECIWSIAEERLRSFQKELNEKYKECEDLEQRKDIAKNLGKIAIELKNKSLEEFYARR